MDRRGVEADPSLRWAALGCFVRWFTGGLRLNLVTARTANMLVQIVKVVATGDRRGCEVPLFFQAKEGCSRNSEVLVGSLCGDVL